MSCLAFAALVVLVQEPRLAVQQMEGGIRIEQQVVTGPDGGPVRSGDFLVLDAEGTKLVQGEFREGQRHGRWRWRWPDGEKRVLGWYKDGVPVKDWEFWRADGRRQARGKYVDGRRSGRWELWDDEGALLEEEAGVYTWAADEWPDATRRAQGYLLDGERHGPWTFFWPDGGVRLVKDYVRGEAAGCGRFRHVDGTPDRQMYPDQGRAASVLPGLEEPLTSLPGNPEPPASDEAGLAPSATAAMPHHPGFPAQSPEARQRVEALLAGGEGALPSATEWLIAQGRLAVPAILERLFQLRLEEPLERERGQRLHAVLRAIAGGRAPAWDPAADPRALRLAVLRWYSFWAAAFEDDQILVLDLALPPRTGEDPSALVLAPPFGVQPEGRQVYPGRFRAQPEHAEAVEAALGWLAAHQSEDGSWSGEGFAERCGVVAACSGAGEPGNQIGLTAASLLAFLAAGNTTAEGPWSPVVEKGFRWLLRQQDPETGRMPVFRHDHHYGDALATLAFSEATCFSSSPVLRRAAERGVEYILAARNAHGAWRYEFPPVGPNDTSVSVWMVRALCAARRAGIPVPPEALEGALAWLDEVTDPKTGRVGYEKLGTLAARTEKNQHYPPEKGESMTAAGLYCRFLCGQLPSEHPVMHRYADLLLRCLPEWEEEGLGCDMYYWLGGSEAMWQMGGKGWKVWNAALQRALLGSQQVGGHEAGSWDPIGPWGYVGGRVYATSFCTLALLAARRQARLVQ